METILQKVTVTTNDGRVAKFEIAYDPDRYEGQRAYSGTKYYDMDTFNLGLAKAAKVDFEQVADLFEHPASLCVYKRAA